MHSGKQSSLAWLRVKTCTLVKTISMSMSMTLKVFCLVGLLNEHYRLHSVQEQVSDVTKNQRFRTSLKRARPLISNQDSDRNDREGSDWIYVTQMAQSLVAQQTVKNNEKVEN